MWKFYKYHALGNDYLVINPQDLSCDLTPEKIKIICDVLRRATPTQFRYRL